LAINGLTVHLLGSVIGSFLAIESHKGVALAGVVDISHRSELIKLGLKIPIGHVLVHSVDEKFGFASTTISTSSIGSTATSTSSSTSTSSTPWASFTRFGFVDLDLLAINGLTVHLLGSGLGSFPAIKSHKGKALAGVVDISHHSELLELGLEIPIVHVLVHSVDKKFASLLSHDAVDEFWILLETGSVLKDSDSDSDRIRFNVS